jgi:hypothetical protein
MENFTALGTFWLPDAENAARAGTLVFDATERNTIVLRIAGSFEDGLAMVNDTSQSYAVVFGVLETGRQVTLANVLKIGSSLNINEVTVNPVTLLAHWVLVGGHFPNGIETEFPDFAFNFDRLDEWALSMRPTNVLLEELTESGVGRLRIEPPEETVFAAFGGEIKVTMGNSVSFNPNLFRAERSANLVYAPESPMTLPSMVDRVITPFSQFIEFANGRPLHLSKLDAHFPPNDRTVNDRILPTFIEVAFSGWRPPHDDADGLNVPTLPLIAMKDRESELLERWMNLHVRAREAFGLIFSISSGPTLYLETRFLLAIQGLEVMHRRILPGRALEPDELQRRIQAAQLGTDDPTVREWFNSKLQYAGEKTLRARLREILGMIGEPGRFTANDFVQKAVTTRNFFTHYDPSSGQPEADQALHYLTLQVLATFDLFLFNQLGFENDKAAAIFSESPRAKELAFQRSVAAQG